MISLAEKARGLVENHAGDATWYEWTDSDGIAKRLAFSPFDRLDQIAAYANRNYHQSGTLVRQALTHARNAGLALLVIKDRLPHGTYEDWVDKNFDGGLSTARLYKRIAKNWERLDLEELAGETLSGVREYIQHVEYFSSDAATNEQKKPPKPQRITTRSPDKRAPIIAAKETTIKIDFENSLLGKQWIDRADWLRNQLGLPSRSILVRALVDSKYEEFNAENN